MYQSTEKKSDVLNCVDQGPLLECSYKMSNARFTQDFSDNTLTHFPAYSVFKPVKNVPIFQMCCIVLPNLYC